jgi:hypothetical protein
MKQKILLVIGGILPYVPTLRLFIGNISINDERGLFLLYATNALTFVLGLFLIYFGFKSVKGSYFFKGIAVVLYLVGVVIESLLMIIGWNLIIIGPSTLF